MSLDPLSLGILGGTSLLGSIFGRPSRPRVQEPVDTLTSQRSSSSTALTPEQQQAAESIAAGNQFRLGLAQESVNAFGGPSALFDPARSPFRLTPEAEAARTSLLASQGVRGDLDRLFNIGTDVFRNVASQPISVPSIGSVSVGFQPRTFTFNPVEVPAQQPVDVARIDPTAAIASARNILSTVAGPAITSQLTAAGQGRSGALTEALSQRATEMALPIQQQILATEAAANQLKAQITARQEEIETLQTVASRLAAQSLTAQSQFQAEQIGAQIASVQAQIQARLAEVQFNGQLQASLVQRSTQLDFALRGLQSFVGVLPSLGEGDLRRQLAQLEAAQLPNTLRQQDLLRAQQGLTSLAGLTPSGFPGGGEQKQETASFTDVPPFSTTNPFLPPPPATVPPSTPPGFPPGTIVDDRGNVLFSPSTGSGERG